MPSVVDRLVWYVNMDNTDSETPPPTWGTGDNFDQPPH